MKSTRILGSLLVSAMVLFWGAQSVLAEVSPQTLVEKAMTEVLAAVENDNIDKESKKQVIKKIASQLLDVEKISQRSVGKYWAGQSPENQRQFKGLFADFLGHLYLSSVLDIKSAQVLEQRRHGPIVRVDVNVRTKKQDKAMIITFMLYKPAGETGEWKVYDIKVDDESLISNYRAQFYRILSTLTFEELLEKMRSQIDDLKKNQ